MGVGEKPGKTTHVGRRIVTFIVWIVVVLAVAIAVLYIASRIGEFESISAMLDFISSELNR